MFDEQRAVPLQEIDLIRFGLLQPGRLPAPRLPSCPVHSGPYEVCVCPPFTYGVEGDVSVPETAVPTPTAVPAESVSVR